MIITTIIVEIAPISVLAAVGRSPAEGRRLGADHRLHLEVWPGFDLDGAGDGRKD